MRTYDFHTHTSFSGDCKSQMESMIQYAIDHNFQQLCITDHYDYDYPTTELTNITFEVDLPEYANGFMAYKEKYKKDIELLFGIEVGLQPHIYDEILENLRPYPFDFIIGSSHVVNKLDPYLGVYYEDKTKQEAYAGYLEDILYHVNHYQYYNVYGHLDILFVMGTMKIKKMYYHDHHDLIDMILRKIIETGHGIELNTSGYRQKFKEPHPNTDILKRYAELGGEIITIGSDAHIPEHLGYHFNEAYTVLKHLGFNYFTIFKEMNPTFIKIP